MNSARSFAKDLINKMDQEGILYFEAYPPNSQERKVLLTISKTHVTFVDANSEAIIWGANHGWRRLDTLNDPLDSDLFLTLDCLLNSPPTNDNTVESVFTHLLVTLPDWCWHYWSNGVCIPAVVDRKALPLTNPDE